eukprot:4522575-Pleurochrysis_carterae.AAC.6
MYKIKQVLAPFFCEDSKWLNRTCEPRPCWISAFRARVRALPTRRRCTSRVVPHGTPEQAHIAGLLVPLRCTAQQALYCTMRQR